MRFDPARTWTYDRSHYPEPLSPMTASLWFEAMGDGLHAACRELQAPFGGFHTTTIDHWAYESEREADWEPDVDAFHEACLDIARRWDDELLPRVNAITAEVRALRPWRPPADEALAMYDRLVELVFEQWRIHFLAVVSVHTSREILADRYAEVLGGNDLEPYRLLEGLPNTSLDADEALLEVAEAARAHDVADLVLELPASAVLDELGRSHDGRAVLRSLAGYLDEWGARSRLHELAEPRHAERPEFVIDGVRLLLEQPRDLAGERDGRARERDRLEAETLARIADPDARAELARLLERVKSAAPLEEGHSLHIDQRGLQAVREALLGFGARLVDQGRLERRDDIFLFDRHEVRAALGRDHGAALMREARRRRLDLRLASSREPALVAGAPREAGDPHPVFQKFYGSPGAARFDGGRLSGYAASPGRASGTARVVRDREDFGRIRAGDVLVCATTTPSWTPVFTSIAGLVTDTGGILCHAAVVAREYGLPAVVGTEEATARIADGDRIEVDGDAGEVWITSS
jgi:rifampicin phosphotransferase